jgi:very-short-patch-repair endonuclease
MRVKLPHPPGLDPVFAALLRSAKLPLPTPEYRFAPPRRWRADYCWTDERVILEVEGGVWSRGRHTRGSGFLKDVEKYNHAALLGYRVLRCTPATLCTTETLRMIEAALSPRAGRLVVTLEGA